ncbi:hypothetical protein CEXT_800241 [Caerostris extrusa]|uniref:Uncharacterized protein n=1 Tax=Caerostris extrusa TaxID=172846 RepID=A0AAV4XR69_CAEEX|nr:hypothetical protein CEXT_800241 [Caerostris extrusa]
MLNELIWEYHVSALDESHITEPPAVFLVVLATIHPKEQMIKGSSSFLFNVDLKTKKGKEHWIKRGTSLILSSK